MQQHVMSTSVQTLNSALAKILYRIFYAVASDYQECPFIVKVCIFVSRVIFLFIKRQNPGRFVT